MVIKCGYTTLIRCTAAVTSNSTNAATTATTTAPAAVQSTSIMMRSAKRKMCAGCNHAALEAIGLILWLLGGLSHDRSADQLTH